VTALLAAEWLKLRTTRAPNGLVFGLLAFVALVVGLTSAFIPGEDLPTTNWSESLPAALLSPVTLFALVLGILLMGWEFRHATITSTFLARPVRQHVVLAKVLVGALAGIALALAASLVAVAVAYPIVTLRDASLGLDGDFWRGLRGLVVASAIFGALGVGLVAVMRNQVLAIVLSLAWLFVVEGVFVALLPDVGKFLPGTAVQALTGDPGFAGGAVPLLSRAGAGIVSLAYVLGFAVAGAVMTVRRDVS